MLMSAELNIDSDLIKEGKKRKGSVGIQMIWSEYGCGICCLGTLYVSMSVTGVLGLSSFVLNITSYYFLTMS